MAVNTAPRPDTEVAPLPKMERKDAWWVSTYSFVIVFTAFALWATFRAFENAYFDTSLVPGLPSHYLTPFYSPTIPIHWSLGTYVISPALYILIFPLGFRLTCYYYRKQIYRGYLADPAGCAVTEPKILEKARYKRYRGERAFPLIIMNIHRFAFYAAAIFVIILWKDTFDAFLFTDNGSTHFGMGLGTLIFLTNILLLSAYTFSCHSWRHLIGGGTDCYSCSVMNQTRYGMWKKISYLNEKHGLWAMASLFSVGITDVYVWLVASGRIQDIRFF